MFLQSFHSCSLCLTICVCLEKISAEVGETRENPNGNFSCMIEEGKKIKPSPPLPLYIVIIEGDRRMRIDSWVGLVISFFLSSNLTIPVLPMRIAVLMTHSCFDRDPSSWKLDGSYKRNQEVTPHPSPPPRPQGRRATSPVPRKLHHKPVSKPEALVDASSLKTNI